MMKGHDQKFNQMFYFLVDIYRMKQTNTQTFDKNEYRQNTSSNKRKKQNLLFPQNVKLQVLI